MKKTPEVRPREGHVEYVCNFRVSLNYGMDMWTFVRENE